MQENREKASEDNNKIKYNLEKTSLEIKKLDAFDRNTELVEKN